MIKIEHLKGRVTRFFAFGFLHESVSPELLITPEGPFRIFSQIRGDIRSSRFATSAWQMENIFNQKNFYDFFWTPLGSTVSIYIIFYKFILSCQQFDYCSHCLPPV